MSTLGHVRYVTERDAGPEVSMRELLGAVLGDPAGLIGVLTLVAVLLLLGVLLPVHPAWARFRVVLDEALRGYRSHLPLILRLSAGIALMGAGVAGYWFVPHAPFDSRVLGLVLMACGFGLLIGVAVTFLALLASILWLFGLATTSWDLFMAFDVLAMLVLLSVLSAGRPSVDDLLVKALPSAPFRFIDRRRLRAALDPDPSPALVGAFDTWVPFLARLGLGVSLLYAGVVEKWLDPGPALATAERYGLDFGGLDEAFFVVILGATEVLLALGILAGIGTRPLSALAFFAFTSTLFALPDDPVVAHVPAWGIATVVFILGPGTWTLPHLLSGRSQRQRDAAAVEAADDVPAPRKVGEAGSAQRAAGSPWITTTADDDVAPASAPEEEEEEEGERGRPSH